MDWQTYGQKIKEQKSCQTDGKDERLLDEWKREKKEKKKLEPLTVEDLLSIPIPKEPKPDKKKKDVKEEAKDDDKVRWKGQFESRKRRFLGAGA